MGVSSASRDEEVIGVDPSIFRRYQRDEYEEIEDEFNEFSGIKKPEVNDYRMPRRRTTRRKKNAEDDSGHSGLSPDTDRSDRNPMIPSPLIFRTKSDIVTLAYLVVADQGQPSKRTTGPCASRRRRRAGGSPT